MAQTRYDQVKELLTKKLGTMVGSEVALVLWPVYVTAKFFKSTFNKLQIYYEIQIAPSLVKNMYWLFWPAYKLLTYWNVSFVINIGDGVGHIIPELDDFFRASHLGDIGRNKRYLWIRKSNIFSKTCVGLYRHKFWWAVSSNLVYNLILPITIKYKDITFDCGHSRLKWQLTDTNEYHIPLHGQTYLYRISKRDEQIQYKAYYKRRQKCSNYIPLKEATFDNSQLINFLHGKSEKLALIQIKANVMNATAKATVPETYLDALGYLKERGYLLVFAGREKMPQVFQRYEVLNYAESPIASFKNDIQLFILANFAIIGGSGLSWLADCLNVPYLYLNSWHLGRAMFSRYCIGVPTLVERRSGELLGFLEQIRLYESMADLGHEIFPHGKYHARNASSDEILSAVKELIHLKENYWEHSALQERFRRLHENAWLKYSEMQLSNYFLEKHSNLF